MTVGNVWTYSDWLLLGVWPGGALTLMYSPPYILDLRVDSICALK